jgi:hypothetical protein
MDVADSITFMSASSTPCNISDTNHLEDINENESSKAKPNRNLFANVRYFLINSDLPQVNLKSK